MPRSIRTAVAAVSQASRAHIARCLADADIALDCMCDDGPSALRALIQFRPELLVTDTFLPGMDGQTLAKHALFGFRMPVRPAVIILHDNHYSLPESELLYSRGALILKKNTSPADFTDAVKYLRSTELHFTSSELQTADTLLDALGVPEHIGRECLRRAALLCAADQRFEHKLSVQLYPKVGETCGISPRQAERAMRHAIDLAWKSDKFDNQYRIFADTVDAGRGQPTCGEMILRLADILRSEG